jgi:hypothetical protein
MVRIIRNSKHIQREETNLTDLAKVMLDTLKQMRDEDGLAFFGGKNEYSVEDLIQMSLYLNNKTTLLMNELNKMKIVQFPK